MPAGLKSGIEGIASWIGLPAGSRDLFRGFVPSGARSYICVLNEPIETPVGPASAIKLKAIGKTDLEDSHPPLNEEYGYTAGSVSVDDRGFVSVGRADKQPLFGSTFNRVERENRFMFLANSKRLPAPHTLGTGEYSDLSFNGQNLGFNIMAICDWETDLRRLGNMFQNGSCPSPREYLIEIARSFFGYNAGVSDLEILFYEAGKVQRQFNNSGLISNDSHIGNFAITTDSRARLNDFGKGDIKECLNPAQISILQLLDINKFIFSAYRLRAWPSGNLLLSLSCPISAYLEGYLGKDIFERRLKEIGSPEKIIRGFPTPEKEQSGDRGGFKSSIEIMRYSWISLYDALQEILAGEGNAFPLSPAEKLKRFTGMYKSYFEVGRII